MPTGTTAPFSAISGDVIVISPAAGVPAMPIAFKVSGTFLASNQSFFHAAMAGLAAKKPIDARAEYNAAPPPAFTTVRRETFIVTSPLYSQTNAERLLGTFKNPLRQGSEFIVFQIRMGWHWYCPPVSGPT